MPPAVFSERYLNDSAFRSEYNEKLKKRREKMKMRNQAKANMLKNIKEGK